MDLFQGQTIVVRAWWALFQSEIQALREPATSFSVVDVETLQLAIA